MLLISLVLRCPADSSWKVIWCLERMLLAVAAGEADEGSGSDGGGGGMAAASPSRGGPQDIIAQAPPRRAGDLDTVADTRPQMPLRTAIQRWQVGARARLWVLMSCHHAQR